MTQPLASPLGERPIRKRGFQMAQRKYQKVDPHSPSRCMRNTQLHCSPCTDNREDWPAYPTHHARSYQSIACPKCTPIHRAISPKWISATRMRANYGDIGSPPQRVRGKMSGGRGSASFDQNNPVVKTKHLNVHPAGKFYLPWASHLGAQSGALNPKP